MWVKGETVYRAQKRSVRSSETSTEDSLKLSFNHFWTKYPFESVSNQCTELEGTLKVTWFITNTGFIPLLD